MGISHGDFTMYPRTPHLLGSKGTNDDKHLSEAESRALLGDASLIVEEKIDGTNVGIHFSDAGRSSRGSLAAHQMKTQLNNVSRGLLLAILSGLAALVLIDYASYRVRDRRAAAVVSELGGSAGSLLGWPFGKERRISFTRPLTSAELDRLSVLNALTSRDDVEVAFDCDLTPHQLDEARSALPNCRVFCVADRVEK